MHVGQRFSSSKKVALSETGTEYEVSCLKHVFANHILLQFQLNNTLEDQLLEDVTVSLDLTGCPGLTLDSELKCPSLPFGSPADCFVCLRRTEGVPVGTLPATLKFLVKDVDPANGGVPDEGETGYDDEYNLEELEIVAADFVKKVAVVDFKEAWSTIGADHEVIETFSLLPLAKAGDGCCDGLSRAAAVRQYGSDPCGGRTYAYCAIVGPLPWRRPGVCDRQPPCRQPEGGWYAADGEVDRDWHLAIRGEQRRVVSVWKGKGWRAIREGDGWDTRSVHCACVRGGEERSRTRERAERLRARFFVEQGVERQGPGDRERDVACA